MKILRDMAIANQGRAGFDYSAFKHLLQREQFVKGQMMPLNMRLDVLESFFEPGSVPGASLDKSKHPTVDDTWKFAPGTLTIIDLSCPFVGQDDACALFNIAVSLFLKNRHDTGRIIALDEAHKVSGSFLTCDQILRLDSIVVYDFDLSRSLRFDRDTALRRPPAAASGRASDNCHTGADSCAVTSRALQCDYYSSLLITSVVQSHQITHCGSWK
jgi:hypothetical protein